MTPETRKRTERIKRILSTQPFANWYNSGRFNDWIEGCENPPSDEDILTDIYEMFELGNFPRKKPKSKRQPEEN